MRTRYFAIAGLLALAACNFDILNTNQPTQGDLLGNPTRGKLTAAATGVMSSTRTGMVSFIWRLGSMGREGINLSGNNQPDYSEPYFGPVQAGGSFGGTQWLERFQSIRTANIYLQALANNLNLSGPDLLTDAERAASRGMANTFKALAFLYAIETRAQLGAPVSVETSIDQGPAKWVTEDSVYGYIVGLLDSAATDLTTADSTAFPFPIPPGLATFSLPVNFLKFNRALAAKANVLRATALTGCHGTPSTCYTAALTALGQSFLNTAPGAFQTGAYLDFSTAPGDQTNDLSEPLDGSTFFALTDNIADADTQTNGAKDERVRTKIDSATVVQRLGGISIPGQLKFTVFFSNGTADANHPIPIIKDEELLLLRSEASWFGSPPNKVQAVADLNLVRQNSGLLPPSTVTPASTDAAFIAALLYERRFSLLWEQGTRWIDARRFGLLSTIKPDVTGGNVPEAMPVPITECSARNLSTKTIGDIVTCTPLSP
jgi:starch-binding outer membrane protein, SusD/RagB family